jgi:hypothetical protein
MPQLRPVATSALFLPVGVVSTTSAGKNYISPQTIQAGTQTPGHELLPVDTRIEYLATPARPGGDEFGMLRAAVKN